MISARHIRAAREALNWSQGQLAARAGVTQSTISGIEHGTAPNSATVAAITAAFHREGVVLHPNGIEWRNGATYELTGADFWLKVLDDVYDTLIDKPDRELILLCSDDRESSPVAVDRNRKMRNAGIRFRQFVRESNTYLLGPVAEYRWVPKERFHNTVSVLYGDKIAVCSEDNTKAVVIKDAALAATWRNLVELLWQSLEQPDRSTADARF